jgi:hypothetical protein
VSSIIPSISAAVAGVAQSPNQQGAAVRESPAAVQVASQQAGGVAAADNAAKGPEVKPKSRAPSTQKRVESGFAGQGPKQTAQTKAGPEEEDLPKGRPHDGKLSVVA